MTAEAEPDPSRALRRLFLLLFLRGRSARGQARERRPMSVPRQLASALLLYALIGCMSVGFGRDPAALSLASHAFTFLMLTMFIAAAGGEVLFARDENDVLLHRPISPGDLLRAKARVLVEVSLWLAGALNLGPLIAGSLGPAGLAYAPAHALAVAGEALCSVAMVVLTYQLCLRWFGRERLDTLMTVSQVAMAAVMAVAGQVAPRMARGAHAPAGRWALLLPPAWFAALDDVLRGAWTPHALIAAGVGAGVTVAACVLAFARLAEVYGRGLREQSEAQAAPARAARGRTGRLANLPPLRWWLRDPVARASFTLCVAYLLRDRETRLRVYPALAPMLALPVVMLVALDDVGGASIGVAFCSGYLGLVPLIGQEHLRYSQQWTASELFRCAPITGPAPICRGARWAVLLVLTLPAVALVIGIAAAARPHQLPMLLPGLIVMPIYALLPGLGGRGLPLSTPIASVRTARRGLAMIAISMCSMGVAVLALFAREGGWLRWFLAGEGAVVLVIVIGLRHALARARWPRDD